MIPKDEGQGLMLSSFCSREFGYDMIISNEDMALINNYRDGKAYSDELAAQTINHHSCER